MACAGSTVFSHIIKDHLHHGSPDDLTSHARKIANRREIKGRKQVTKPEFGPGIDVFSPAPTRSAKKPERDWLLLPYQHQTSSTPAALTTTGCTPAHACTGSR